MQKKTTGKLVPSAHSMEPQKRGTTILLLVLLHYFCIFIAFKYQYYSHEFITSPVGSVANLGRMLQKHLQNLALHTGRLEKKYYEIVQEESQEGKTHWQTYHTSIISIRLIVV